MPVRGPGRNRPVAVGYCLAELIRFSEGEAVLTLNRARLPVAFAAALTGQNFKGTTLTTCTVRTYSTRPSSLVKWKDVNSYAESI
jgi:hypothetical protein